jgi:alginate O-acetyltransferase complex protein AlgI
VKPLFESPLRSSSLSNFWSQRWNRPFVELNKIFFMPWLVRRLGMRGAIFVIFLVSGLLHEMAISYPAGAGWGMPLGYFALQGVMVLLERKVPFKGPIWVALVVLVPIPILFHAAFRETIILPFLAWTRAEMLGLGLSSAVSMLIYVLGFAQFCILSASFQVPTRLRWKEELPRLSTLNQKLMWTYGSFIVYTIASFGVLTLVLHDEILLGTRAGLALSVMMLLWWTLRLATDVFYFKSDDWPKGRFMQIGHVMLNCLFTFVLSGYGCVLVCHIYRLI